MFKTMNGIKYISIFTIMLILAVFSNNVGAQLTIWVNQTNSNPIFDTSVISVTEAGNNFNSTISQTTSNTLISIDAPQNTNWSVYASYSSSGGNYNIDVKRSGSGTNRNGGTATGSISGGQTPVILSSNPTLFYQGKSDRYNVPVLFSLSNLTVLNTAGNITYTITFTVTSP